MLAFTLTVVTSTLRMRTALSMMRISDLLVSRVNPVFARAHRGTARVTERTAVAGQVLPRDTKVRGLLGHRFAALLGNLGACAKHAGCGRLAGRKVHDVIWRQLRGRRFDLALDLLAGVVDALSQPEMLGESSIGVFDLLVHDGILFKCDAGLGDLLAPRLFNRIDVDVFLTVAVLVVRGLLNRAFESLCVGDGSSFSKQLCFRRFD